MPWRVALRSRNLWMIMAMYHTYCWGSFFYLSWLPTYLAKGRGFTENELRTYAMLPFLAGICGNLFGGWLSDRLVKRYGLKIGRLSVGTCGLALSAACVLGAALSGDRYQAAYLIALGYGCMDCMLPVSWSICLDVGRQHAGAITGAMNMAGQVGSFLSSSLFGYALVYLYNNDYNGPLVPLAGMLFVSAILYLFIDPTKEILAPKADRLPLEPAPALAGQR